MAIPYPVKDSHLLFFASFAWRTLGGSAVAMRGWGAVKGARPMAAFPRLRFQRATQIISGRAAVGGAGTAARLINPRWEAAA